MTINPFILHGEEVTPVRKLIYLKAFAGGGGLSEYEVTGNPVAFNTNVAKPLSAFTIPFLPVQSGTGDPYPSNVRPISGWSGVNAWRTGVNLFDANAQRETNCYYNSSGEKTTNSDYDTTGYIRVKASTDYYWAINGIPVPSEPSHNAPRIAYYDANKNYISSSGAIGLGASFTTPATCSFIRLPIYKRNSNQMLVEGSTAPAEYSAYTGQSYPVTFPDGQTVYGGTLDAVNGVLTVEWVSLTKTWGDFGNKTSLGDNTRGTLNISSYPSKPSSTAVDAKCNIAPRDTGWSTDSIHFYANEGSCVVFLPNDTDASTEIQVVYPLATPIEIPLSYIPVPVTLIGDNTIWTDTNGENTIKYKKKG